MKRSAKEMIMGDKAYVIGLFRNGGQAASAIEALKGSPWILDRVHSPFPEHRIFGALRLKKSRVGYFTLAGGIFGFLFGFALAIYTATRWHLIVSGKPVGALIPFFIVGFEFTILFAVFGNVLGLISQARLPRFKMGKLYDPRFSGDRFGVLASCPVSSQTGLYRFFEAKGAEIKTYRL